MEKSYGFPIKKPVSVLNKSLKVNFNSFFKNLTKTVIHATSQNWNELPTDFFEILVSMGIEKSNGEIAWMLIYNSISSAIIDLVKDSSDLFTKIPEDIDNFIKKIDFSLEKNVLIIDKDFIEKPKELRIIEDIKKPFEQWLKGFGLNYSQAKSISNRIPTYFVFSLHKEWHKRPKEYTRLFEALRESPFIKACENEKAWLYYSSWLQKQVNEHIFYEAFGLNQIYISLNSYYKKKKSDDNETFLEKDIFSEQENYLYYVVELQGEIEAWLKKADKNDALRIICGGPGCGKSSFCKMFAAQQSEKGDIPVLYVPLYFLDPKENLKDEIEKFLDNGEFNLKNPLKAEHSLSQLLIIFDGLDELAMQGKVSAEIAKDFIREIDKIIVKMNFSRTRLQVIISGREILVQNYETEFRKEKQILYILPYYKFKEEKKEFIDENHLLNIDQRQIWWKKYGELIGTNYKGIPEDLNNKIPIEITSHPLLNYLVAINYKEGKLDFSKAGNRNSLYEMLITSIYEGRHTGHPYPSTLDLRKNEFFHILEEIAVCVWHGDGRKATVKEIKSRCIDSDLDPLLDKFQEVASKSIFKLLTAFYFRHSGFSPISERTFEFTHKSFSEYLSARNIIRAIKRINEEFERKIKDLDKGWTELEALKYFINICGPTALDSYILRFISDEIALTNIKELKKWQYSIAKLLNFILIKGMPIFQWKAHLYFNEINEITRNAEEALLAIHSSISNITSNILESKSIKNDEYLFGVWLSKLQGKRRSNRTTIAVKSLNHLNLSNSFLDSQYLYGANFKRTLLMNANLVLSNLSYSNLTEANLSRANLTEANLSRANLSRANLTGANLREANLTGANLTEANLSRANLARANLRGANLRGANLTGAYLARADLRETDMREANLTEANLTEANLRKAYLTGAYLAGADLTGAVLG